MHPLKNKNFKFKYIIVYKFNYSVVNFKNIIALIYITLAKFI